ncbi:MAG: glycosyltransferase family 1 protein [Thermomicrobiales bacterium]|nr:glycosyltransferase family 1 protein [Thermomicrobiales bacterium]
MGSRRVVVAAWGSFGDLNPHLALALGLQDRGHRVVFATAEFYRSRVEDLGLTFRPMRPDLPDWQTPGVMRALNDSRRGTERVVRRLIFPALRQTYADVLPLAADADLLVSSLLAVGARLAAERVGIQSVTTALQPSLFFSAYDPPALGLPSGLDALHRLPPAFHRLVFRAVAAGASHWFAPWRAARAELGLSADAADGFMIGPRWQGLVLALFSPLLATPQPDWPADAIVTGFPFDRRVDGDQLPAVLRQFLDAGPAPLVFTLGSTAVLEPGRFFAESVQAARLLGRRAILLSGPDAPTGIVQRDPDMLALVYAPHAPLFPRAEAIVHHGGIGTLSQAMRAGRPSLIVPFAHDQPDNARRAARLGIATVLRPRRYRGDTAARALRLLLDDATVRARTAAVAEQVRAEDGVRFACEAIESRADGRT